jgi:hypothetical protein
MYEQHWQYMRRIIELGDGPRVYARYNTNLSRVSYRGIDLYTDILANLRDWQVCASLDGTGEIGEYIRTGLDYNQWLENFRRGLEIRTNARQMRIDFTLTLPGMFEIGRMQALASELGVELLAKVVFGFSPDIVMSPLALPRELLEPWIDEHLNDNTLSSVLRDMLIQLRSRPTFSEQFPDSYVKGLAQGKRRVLQLERIRTQSLTMTDILGARPDILQWWMQIES